MYSQSISSKMESRSLSFTVFFPENPDAVNLCHFELVKQKAKKIGFDMCPAEVITDFELASEPLN